MAAPASSRVIFCTSPRGAKLLVARHLERTVLYVEIGKKMATLELATVESDALGQSLVAPIALVPRRQATRGQAKEGS